MGSHPLGGKGTIILANDNEVCSFFHATGITPNYIIRRVLEL